MKPTRTWVLIADGARARLIVATGHGKAIEIDELAEYSADHSPNRELQRDAAPRVYDSQGTRRSAIEPKVDPHRELKRDFAADLAETLEGLVQRKEIGPLIVAAAPTTLGDLRKAFSKRVHEAIVAELAMDLTKVPNADLPKHIRESLPH